ncbi:Spo0E like sporulation regulatory protein [compost metagenome]
MIESSRKKGIKNMDTVRLSQELDKLILAYQRGHTGLYSSETPSPAASTWHAA